MASVTVNKSRLGLPWYGCVVLIVEIGTYSNTDTLVLSSVDGGQGISFVYGVMGFTVDGQFLAFTAAASPKATANATTITMGTTTTATTLIVFGR